MELPIAHIFQGEKGGPVKEKLNTVIDIINALGDDASVSTGLLSNYVFFRNNDLNPNAPDVDILLFASGAWLRWKVAGQIYQYNILGYAGYNITLDEFDGEDEESRIDTIYAITPPILAQPQTGIKVRKGTNAENPTAPGINTATEVLLGYVYLNVGGFSEGIGNGADDAVVVGTGKDSVNGWQEVLGKKYFNNRVLFTQASDLASANSLTLTNARFFRLTDAANELQTIRNSGWTGGTDILLEIKTGQTVKHDYAGNSTYNGILLACQNDFTASQDLILHLVWDGNARKWKEVGGTTIAAIVERPWYTAIRVQCHCFEVDADSYINFEAGDLTGCTVTNEGTASVSIVNNAIQFGSSGTAYYVTVFDSLGVEKYLFPLIENWRDTATETFVSLNGVWDVITEKKFLLIDAVGLDTHDDAQLMYMHNVGETVVIEGDYTYNVPYDLNGNPII